MRQETQNQIGLFLHSKASFESTLAQTIEALKAEGFGVLTEIDVQATMKKKLGVDLLPYKILGACNPPLAHKALTIAPEVGLLLPCNVTVREIEDGSVEIGLVDPLMMLGVVNSPSLLSVAEEARARLQRVAQALEDWAGEA